MAFHPPFLDWSFSGQKSRLTPTGWTRRQDSNFTPLNQLLEPFREKKLFFVHFIATVKRFLWALQNFRADKTTRLKIRSRGTDSSCYRASTAGDADDGWKQDNSLKERSNRNILWWRKQLSFPIFLFVFDLKAGDRVFGSKVWFITVQ